MEASSLTIRPGFSPKVVLGSQISIGNRMLTLEEEFSEEEGWPPDIVWGKPRNESGRYIVEPGTLNLG